MYTYTKSVEKRPKDVVEQELLKSAGLSLNHLKNKKANIVENTSYAISSEKCTKLTECHNSWMPNNTQLFLVLRYFYWRQR